MEEVQSAEIHEELDVRDEVKTSECNDQAKTNGAVRGEASPGGSTRTRRSAGSSGGHNRYGHRRSPTTGHRMRRQKTPEPNFVPPRVVEESLDQGRRSLSSPQEGDIRRISSSEEEEERKPRRTSKPKSNESKTRLESSKRWSGTTLTSTETSNEFTSESDPPKPVARTRSKSRGKDYEEDRHISREKNAWWKSWPGWSQRIRGKSLERELGGAAPLIVPPRRNRSLERPPVIKEKEKRAKQAPPVATKRSKSKTRTVSDVEKLDGVEESSDDFWKCNDDSLRKRKPRTEKKRDGECKLKHDTATDVAHKSIEIPSDVNRSKEMLLVETSAIIPAYYSNLEEINNKVKEEPKEKSSLKESIQEVRLEWESFFRTSSGEIKKIRNLRNKCLVSFVILLIYCGTGAFIFRFVEGAFESFYKCGVKRVKRDFVESLWLSSHNLREEEWKSLARRKLMEFEEQLHTAYEAGMMSYSGLKAWSFLNAFIYCLTVVTTIGYGHISPSTTTGRVITIVYAIFGIPMFLILLADFGKLFTRGIKFVWAFVRRLYYTGSCRKVRRTVPVQEMMKGVQMVYDIATFRRPSQLPPGVVLDEGVPPPLPPRVYTPGEAPGTPALSTYAIDDEFNLPISVAIFILLIYIICGATVFYMWESWGFFESFYFVFISMSTIGFGDFVPQNQMYMMASIVYLVFGLALTSMCINVVQEKLSDSFRQASAKIGATIGLRVAEEDGAVTPVPPAPVELPEVHSGFLRASPSTPPTTTELAS